MVLFQNITVGQRVEVKLGHVVFRGIVKYKGPVVNKKGEWVGVSLDQPVGDNDGLVNGRRYFQSGPSRGIFVRAAAVRFIPMVRCLYNKYHKVSDRSFVEEPLFGSRCVSPEPMRVPTPYKDRINSSFDDLFPASRPIRYPLNHSVGNHIPAATMRRAKSAMAAFSYCSTPVHCEYNVEGEFITSPSIPKTHMPHSALRNQVRRGWQGAHYAREMSVPTGRDSIKFSQWNDISA